METPILEDILTRLRAALENDDVRGAADIIAAMRPPDQAEVFSELDDDHQRRLLPHLSPPESADILEELDETEAADLVADLSDHS